MLSVFLRRFSTSASEWTLILRTFFASRNKDFNASRLVDFKIFIAKVLCFFFNCLICSIITWRFPVFWMSVSILRNFHFWVTKSSSTFSLSKFSGSTSKLLMSKTFFSCFKFDILASPAKNPDFSILSVNDLITSLTLSISDFFNGLEMYSISPIVVVICWISSRKSCHSFSILIIFSHLLSVSLRQSKCLTMSFVSAKMKSSTSSSNANFPEVNSCNCVLSCFW